MGNPGSQMSYIFISYSHKDKKYAHRLEKALKRRGFEVWLDDRIDYGTQWPKTIEEELDGCEALILIMTIHSNGSDWVQSELSRAKRKRKNIFPLLLEGDEPWLSVETTQYVDVRGGKLPTKAFYDALAKVVSRKDVGVSEQIETKPTSEVAMPANLFKNLPPSFRNPFELDAEYILIPGGRYKYQGEDEKDVSSVYFAKYPVTNKRYSRFIRYLQDDEPNLTGLLPKPEFNSRMKELISEIEGLSKHMGNSPDGWPEKLRPDLDTERRLSVDNQPDECFAGEDQPVVGVSWFAARAYCCWLSLLEARQWDLSPEELVNLYRLPTEIEWEWAAGGGKREYPWVPEKGLPSDNLANCDRNVGATTPVGRYPEGATPEGLMDMAGNVWEWMENVYDEDKYKRRRSLRGGSWRDISAVFYLRCSCRNDNYDVYCSSTFGFRVVRSSL